MDYVYKAAWTIVGGINLPQGTAPIEIHKSDSCRFVLTNDPGPLLEDVDSGAAIGRLMLMGLVGKRGTEEYLVATQSHVDCPSV
jgi:hypothetical protein